METNRLSSDCILPYCLWGCVSGGIEPAILRLHTTLLLVRLRIWWNRTGYPPTAYYLTACEAAYLVETNRLSSDCILPYCLWGCVSGGIEPAILRLHTTLLLVRLRIWWKRQHHIVQSAYGWHSLSNSIYLSYPVHMVNSCDMDWSFCLSFRFYLWVFITFNCKLVHEVSWDFIQLGPKVHYFAFHSFVQNLLIHVIPALLDNVPKSILWWYWMLGFVGLQASPWMFSGVEVRWLWVVQHSLLFFGLVLAKLLNFDIKKKKKFNLKCSRITWEKIPDFQCDLRYLDPKLCVDCKIGNWGNYSVKIGSLRKCMMR